jgi:hypothetical protein
VPVHLLSIGEIQKGVCIHARVRVPSQLGTRHGPVHECLAACESLHALHSLGEARLSSRSREDRVMATMLHSGWSEPHLGGLLTDTNVSAAAADSGTATGAATGATGATASAVVLLRRLLLDNLQSARLLHVLNEGRRRDGTRLRCYTASHGSQVLTGSAPSCYRACPPRLDSSSAVDRKDPSSCSLPLRARSPPASSF